MNLDMLLGEVSLKKNGKFGAMSQMGEDLYHLVGMLLYLNYKIYIDLKKETT